MTTNATRRVLVTGADGLIGRLLIDAWRESGACEPVGLARKPGPYADVVADIAGLAALTPAMQGVDAVVHLAASSAVGSPWDAVLAINLIGTYNVFEAARRASVQRVVFASSNHAIGMYEVEAAPALYALRDERLFDELVPVRPDSLYGVSKVFGEVLGRYHVDRHGMRVICLRIGSVLADDDPRDAGNDAHRLRATWLSHRDCAQLIERALDADVAWAVVYGISDNPRQFWDLASARALLGYRPVDRAPD